MAHKIQIRRSTTTGTPGTVLDIGELAYSYLNSTLYIGGAAGVGAAAVPIGGSGTYATLNSPIFTGDPQAPTPAGTDNDTSIATTAWVRGRSLSDFLAPTGNISWANNKITNLATPTLAGDAATKGYVDGLVQGLDSKASVRLKTTANITITSPGAVVANFDGVAPVAGDRILLTNQTTASENGIYVWNGAAVAMTRATDADTSALVTAGQYMFVEEGTAFADTGWVLITNNPIVLGTTALTYTQFNGAGSIIAGNGLTSTGNTFDVVGTAGRIVSNANNIDLATSGVTAGAYIGFTVDTYGRITAVTTPTTLAGYGITNAQPLDADLTAIAAVSTTGLLVRTAADTWATRSVLGVTNRTTVTNGTGVAGDITVDIAATYAGQTSITTLGTVATGTWQANLIGAQYGGTGANLTGVGTADFLIKTNATGTALVASNSIDGGTF
jgi:phage-related tail fiber protein